MNIVWRIIERGKLGASARKHKPGSYVIAVHNPAAREQGMGSAFEMPEDLVRQIADKWNSECPDPAIQHLPATTLMRFEATPVGRK